MTTYWDDDEIRGKEIFREKKYSFIKRFLKYASSRIFVTFYSTVITIFFVDYLGFKYWFFAIFFLPINFLLNFFIYDWVFRKKSPIKTIKAIFNWRPE